MASSRRCASIAMNISLLPSTRVIARRASARQGARNDKAPLAKDEEGRSWCHLVARRASAHRGPIRGACRLSRALPGAPARATWLAAVHAAGSPGHFRAHLAAGAFSRWLPVSVPLPRAYSSRIAATLVVLSGNDEQYQYTTLGSACSQSAQADFVAVRHPGANSFASWLEAPHGGLRGGTPSRAKRRACIRWLAGRDKQVVAGIN